MKICHYDANQAGAIQDGRVHPIGDALVGAGHVRAGYTMREVIEALARGAEAMRCARRALDDSAGVPLASVRLLAPVLDPPSIWAAASNYKAHAEEMRAKGGASDRAEYGADDLM